MATNVYKCGKCGKYVTIKGSGFKIEGWADIGNRCTPVCATCNTKNKQERVSK